METNKTGGCLCGKLRYTLKKEPVQTMVCHCKNCQKTSGSAFSTIALVNRIDIEVTGQPRRYSYNGDSGMELTVNFCGTCGSPVLLDIAAMPSLISVKVGSFDDATWFKPQVAIWHKSAQTWVPDIADCLAVPEGG